MNYEEKNERFSDEVLTVTEAADMLGFTRQHVHGLIKNGTYKPFKYIVQKNTEKRMPLLLKSEILDTEKKKLEKRRVFREEYILSALAKKIMKKRLPDFINDIDKGIIKEYKNISAIPHAKGGYINLEELTLYAKEHGIILDNLITSDAVRYMLSDNKIYDDLHIFLNKHNIKPVYDLGRDRRYALLDRESIEVAIKEEKKITRK